MSVPNVRPQVAYAPLPFALQQGLATYKKYTVFFLHVSTLSAKAKRRVFSSLRKAVDSGEAADLLLPTVGVTLGEFAILQQLHSSRQLLRKSKSK